MLNQFKTSSQLKVDGKMTPKGADTVGLIQAVAWLIIAIAILVFAISYLLR